MNKKWIGDRPKNCDLCKEKLRSFFVDGKSAYGGWAIMCESCHASQGYGLGIGKGQKYRVSDGEKVIV